MNPASIAVVGASPKGGYGLTVLENCTKLGFAGKLYPVHPTADEAAGLQAYPSLSDLPEVPDAVAIAVPAQRTVQVVDEARRLGVGGITIFASGFVETGEEGRALQEQLITAAADLPLVGPNCLGIVNYQSGAALWGITMPEQQAQRHGVVGLAGQSGNMVLTTMGSARIPGIKYAISLGNQAVTDVNDCFEYFISDPDLRVIALIVEGLTDLDRFRRLSAKARAEGKTVVALKVGRSPKGEAATVAHTGTLAGSDAMYDALFKQSGVVRVDDIEQLVAVTKLVSNPAFAPIKSLGVFASSGGECGLVSDLAHDESVELPDFSTEAQEALQALLPDYGSVGNPLDLTAGAWGNAEIYHRVASTLASEPDIDAVVFIGDSPTYSTVGEGSGWKEMLDGAGKAARDHRVPIILTSTLTETNVGLGTMAEEAGVTFIPGVQNLMRAIAKTAVLDGAAESPVEHSSAQEEKWPFSRTGIIDEAESKALLRQYGIATPTGSAVRDKDEAVVEAERIGYPLVCKVVADALAHKSDIGGVRLNLRDAEDLKHAIDEMDVQARHHGVEPTGFYIEEFSESDGGVELIIGGKNEASGTLVVAGIGGTLTELIKDSVSLIWPFSESEALTALGELRLGALLDGYRGQSAVDKAQLARVIRQAGQLLADHPEISELDINPLLVSSEAAVALDALIVTDDSAGE